VAAPLATYIMSLGRVLVTRLQTCQEITTA